MRSEYDLCVIGGGAAGLVVAAGGASLGARVVLVERNKMGGDCLHYGCIPSKTLLHAAHTAHTVRHAGRAGLQDGDPAPHLPKVMARVREVIAAIEPHDSPERFRALGVEVRFGAGHFSGPATFELEGRTLTARRFVIATGSRPVTPPVEGLEGLPFLTNETLFQLDEPVPRLAILGAGAVGVEMAQAFARLGSQVVLIECEARILPQEEEEPAAVVARQLEADGVELLTGRRVARATGEAGALTLELDDGRHIGATHLLVATGRRPNVEGLELARAGVEFDAGGILTDHRLRTSNRRILAAGDVVAGAPRFTHVAEHHAGVVLRNALFHLPARVERRVVPRVLFTDPELARVGMTEREARETGLDHRIYSFPFAELDRGRTDGIETGLARIVTTPRGKLLGATLAGPAAGELIHEYALALSRGLKAAHISSLIHAYPTRAQINRRVADQRLKAGLTPSARRWIQRIFRLRGK